MKRKWVEVTFNILIVIIVCIDALTRLTVPYSSTCSSQIFQSLE